MPQSSFPCPGVQGGGQTTLYRTGWWIFERRRPGPPFPFSPPLFPFHAHTCYLPTRMHTDRQTTVYPVSLKSSSRQTRHTSTIANTTKRTGRTSDLMLTRIPTHSCSVDWPPISTRCPQTKGTNPAIETCGKYYVQFCYEEIILDYILSPFVKTTEIGRTTFIYMGGKGGKDGR